MSTHYAEFIKQIDAGVLPNIYSFKPEEKGFYRLYDGNSYFGGNHNNHACIAAHLTEAEANAAVDLSKRDPKAFAEAFL